MTQQTPTDLPAGMTFTKTGLVARGVVARQLAGHRVEVRPGRRMSNCKFDPMGGNTMTGLHLAEVPPSDYKCDHRHMDETMAFIVAGRGWTELRQSDSGDVSRLDWQAGDVIVTPCNAWHRHVNADSERTFRQLSFRNKPLMDTLVRGNDDPEDLYGARFNRRFADEPDYFKIWEQGHDGAIRTNYIPQAADQPLPAADETLGRDVRRQRYAMGGQRTLDVAVVGIGQGGATRPVAPMAEEALVVMRGRGHTDLWQRGGASLRVHWQAGDLVVPPLGIRRQHAAAPDEAAVLLQVRNVAIERALDVPGPDSTFPDRFPDLIETGGA